MMEWRVPGWFSSKLQEEVPGFRRGTPRWSGGTPPCGCGTFPTGRTARPFLRRPRAVSRDHPLLRGARFHGPRLASKCLATGSTLPLAGRSSARFRPSSSRLWPKGLSRPASPAYCASRSRRNTSQYAQGAVEGVSRRRPSISTRRTYRKDDLVADKYRGRRRNSTWYLEALVPVALDAFADGERDQFDPGVLVERLVEDVREDDAVLPPEPDDPRLRVSRVASAGSMSSLRTRRRTRRSTLSKRWRSQRWLPGTPRASPPRGRIWCNPSPTRCGAPRFTVSSRWTRRPVKRILR